MYAKNVQTLVKHLLKDGRLELDFADEITSGSTITHDGKVVHEATARALGIEPTPPPQPARPAESSAAQDRPDAPAATQEGKA
jgi:NAD(P) transhydrogenase subunit alpha